MTTDTQRTPHPSHTIAPPRMSVEDETFVRSVIVEYGAEASTETAVGA